MAGPEDPDPPPTSSVAHYTTRDLLLYAVGIGCCSDGSGGGGGEDGELRYVHEGHAIFAPFPTFPLALGFTSLPAGGGGCAPSDPPRPSFGIRPFPPPTMVHDSLLPRRLLTDPDLDVGSFPSVHISQSLRLHRPVPLPALGRARRRHDPLDAPGYDPPVALDLSTRTVSVRPTSIGAFVETETEYRGVAEGGGVAGRALLLFTARSTVLVAGVPKDAALPFRSGDRQPGLAPGPPARLPFAPMASRRSRAVRSINSTPDRRSPTRAMAIAPWRWISTGPKANGAPCPRWCASTAVAGPKSSLCSSASF